MSHLYRRPKKKGPYWLAYYSDGKLIRESLKTKSLPAAKLIQNEKDKELLQNKSSVPNQDNLCFPALEEYLISRKHRGSKIANSKTEHEIRDFLTWAQIKQFGQITEKKFQEYLNHKITDEKLKHPTLDRYIASVKAWLKYCVRMHLIFFNPLSYVSKFSNSEEKINPKRFLNKEEIKYIINASKDPDIYIDHNPTLFPVIATGILSGMRPAELFNLEWTDIDFKRKRIMIKNKANFTIKTRKFREVPLFSRLKTVLMPIRKNSGLCFDTTNKRRIFKRILRKANEDMVKAKLLLKGNTALIEEVDWYTLRHTFISHALMDGIPIRTVAAWVGHKRISTTMGYAHLLKEHSEQQIEKLSIKF